jgi:hypothetical protein
MVNDHCLIQDEEGNIHYFGIENPFPTAEQALKVVGGLLRPSDEPFINVLHKVVHGHLYSAGTHFRVGHAVVSGDIMRSWERLPAALDPQKGPSKGYGSPYVVRHDGKYWMFVPSSGTGIYTSTNLTDWTYVEKGTLWGDKTVFGRNHRDPCVVRMDDGTFFQYFATGWDNGLHTIGLASSKDLMHWKAEEPCYVENLPSGTPSGFGIFESPFMMRHEGIYYLFVGFAHRQYYETFVVVSDNPRRFDPKNKITTVFSHAPELIQIDGVTYMSSCGIEDPQALNRSGLRMCRIRWVSP